MRCNPMLRTLFIWALGLLAGLSPLAFAEAVSPQEQVQVYASRATSEGLAARAGVVAAAASALPFRACSFDAVIHTDVLC